MTRLAVIFAVVIAFCLLPMTKIVEGTAPDAPITVEPRQILTTDQADADYAPIQPDVADSLVFNAVVHQLMGDEPTE